MGVLHFENGGGKIMYLCECDVYLSGNNDVTHSDYFYVYFRKVLNVIDYEEVVTSFCNNYIYQNIYCKNCNMHLGVYCEFVKIIEEKYREKTYALKKSLMKIERNCVDT